MCLGVLGSLGGLGGIFWFHTFHLAHFLSRIRGTRKAGHTPAKRAPSFWTPVPLILDTTRAEQFFTTEGTENTENSLLHHEGHEGNEDKT